MSDYNDMIRCLWKGVADTDQQIDAADRIEELEAKLAKAVEALDRIQHGSYGKNAAIARTTLRQLTGGNDE